VDVREILEPGRLASFEIEVRPLLCIEVEEADLVRVDSRDCIRVASSPNPSLPSDGVPESVSYWNGEVKVALSICLSCKLMSAYLEDTETGESTALVGAKGGESVFVFGFESLL